MGRGGWEGGGRRSVKEKVGRVAGSKEQGKKKSKGRGKEREREKESVEGREGIIERGLESVAWVGERVERKEGRKKKGD